MCVYVGRPVIGQPGAKITLFKLDPDGKEAQKVPVTLGRQFGEHHRGYGWVEGGRSGSII